MPKILELDHLTVTGDVYFGRNVTLRGTVIVVANEGQRIDIPDGCILENRLLSGNLTMTVRVCVCVATVLGNAQLNNHFFRICDQWLDQWLAHPLTIIFQPHYRHHVSRSTLYTFLFPSPILLDNMLTCAARQLPYDLFS